MDDKLNTVGAVVEALGGNLAVAAITSAKHSSAISNWKKAGRFPTKTHKPLKRALEECGKSAPDELWGMLP